MKISVVVPAYNEGKSIKKNLEILTKFPDFAEVIVADNASTDDTAKIAKSVPGVKVFTWEKNIGKTNSVKRAVEKSISEHVMFYDADLQAMKPEYIREFLDTYETGNYDMVIMDKGSQPFLFREILKSCPALSGTRICRKTEFQKIKFPGKESFELEQTMNRYFLTQNKRIIVTRAKDVYDPRKYLKYGFLEGLYLDARACIKLTFLDGILGIPRLFEEYRQIRKVLKPE